MGRVHIQVGTLSKAIERWRLCLRVTRFDRFFVLARAAVLVFDFAPAGDCRACQAAFTLLDSAEASGWSEVVGEHEIFQAGAKKRGFQLRLARPRLFNPCWRCGEGV